MEQNLKNCQTHIPNFKQVVAHLNMDETKNIQYSDIFGWLAKQKAAFRILSRALIIQNELLKKHLLLAIPTSAVQWGISGHSTPGMPGEQWRLVKFPLVKYIIIRSQEQKSYRYHKTYTISY